MTDYQGKVIHRSRDRYGELVVADGALTRTLYFGKGTMQSSMFLDEPAVLAMHYMRAMMSALIFNRWPKRVLFIGLGGGTTVKFLRQACPDCLIEAVEIRKEVVRLAHDYFDLPKDHPMTRIIHADGREFVAQRLQEDSAGYDHIFVDAFDEKGPAASLMQSDFIEACRRCLGKSGVLTFDLWTHPGAGYGRNRDLLAGVFGGAILELLQETAAGNALVFAFKDRGAAQLNSDGERRKIARRMQEDFSINFTKFLEEMHRRPET